MDEVLICRMCQAEFHQSYLSAHIEASHASQKQQESISLSCLSCSFTVSALHKNAMIQHCFVTKHNVKDVEVRFNSYLVEERNRIGSILETGLKILNDNFQELNEETKKDSLQEVGPSDDSEESSGRKRRRESDEGKTPRKARKTVVRPIVLGKKKQSLLDTLSNSKIIFHTPFQEETVIKQELMEEEEMPPEKPTIECGKCGKHISEANTPSNKLVNAVTHTLTHLSDLKLFRCRHCPGETSRKLNMRTHLRSHGIGKMSKEDYDMIGTEADATAIRTFLQEAFPSVSYPSDCNIFAKVL